MFCTQFFGEDRKPLGDALQVVPASVHLSGLVRLSEHWQVVEFLEKGLSVTKSRSRSFLDFYWK